MNNDNPSIARYRRHEPARADNVTTQIKTHHTRPSFAALTAKMFPRVLSLMLLLTCILYCHSNVQETKETTTKKSEILEGHTTWSDSAILSTAMVCATFSVLIILVPTVLYQRYLSKKEIAE